MEVRTAFIRYMYVCVVFTIIFFFFGGGGHMGHASYFDMIGLRKNT